MKMPDITPVQITAAAAWVLTQAVSQGLIDDQTKGTILTITSTVILAAFAIGDAWIRHGRSKIAAAAIASATDTEKELEKVKRG
jgi:hypothetical protein